MERFFSILQKWTETYTKWSPKGSYLATCHKQGVALWGGLKFSQQGKFNQKNVQWFDFSPNENYLVTFSLRSDGVDKENKLVMWDIVTGEEKRVFYPDGNPIFKWSYNDKYVAYMGEDVLSIYETPVS